MKRTNLTISDLFTPGAKLTFLVGAGCSVDAPSCLPLGRAMMEAIIDYTCVESEIEKIRKLEQLRFEALVEIIRDVLDKDLKIIDFYGQCDKPNIQHFFLADMIKKGNFVMTTNFDFLIEYALRQSGVPDEDIIPVITREDFEKFKDLYEQYNKGKKTLYKIHGSTKNIIEDQSTRESLIATIQAIGLNKEGENVFQLESFKQPLFVNITKDRSLIVMGYSGSDDFDIVPTLKILKNLRNIIWINYSKNIKIGSEEIYEINAATSESLHKLNKDLRKVTQILLEIWDMKNVDHIYLVNVDTKNMIKNLLNFEPTLSSDNFSIDAMEWLKNNIEMPNEMIRYGIPAKLYYDFDIYEDAMRCLEEILYIAEEEGNQYWKGVALNNIGKIYYAQGNYPEALKRYEEALKIAEQLGDLANKTTYLNNIGLIYNAQGNYSEALKIFEEALTIAKQLGDLAEIASLLNNIGLIYNAQGNYSEALKKYEEALKITEHMGNLTEKAAHLNNIGMVYKAQGSYPEALKRYEEALKIAEQLGNLAEKITYLNNIGMIYNAQGSYPEALKRYEEALKIAEQLGKLAGKATSLSNIATIYYAQGNYPEALKRYEEALKIAEQLGDLANKTTYLNNIGLIYNAQGNYPEALKRYEEALKIAEQLGNLSGKANSLNNIAAIYYAQGSYPEALKKYEEALKIAEQLGDLANKTTYLNNIGLIYNAQGNYSEALKIFEEALKIAKQLGNLSGKAALLNNIGMVYKAQGSYSEALKMYEEALKITKQLGELSGKAALLTNIGEIYKNQGKYPEALKRYEEALKISEQLGNLAGKANCFGSIGEIYYMQGDYPEALKRYDKALKILTKLALSDSPDAKALKKNIEYLKKFKSIELHVSEFAENLNCYNCGKTHSVKSWPLHGDLVPFYYQETPGNFTLPVVCPHCDHKWYVVWDDNPGPIKPLF